MTRDIEDFVANTPLQFSRLENAEFEKDHVSILLALYNGANTLPEQLESIAQQTHKNWSLIVSDDASTDNWREHAFTFATMHEGRTWLIRGPEKGAAQNFLKLVKTAGPMVPYVAFCDQDDFWMPNKLERAINTLKQANPNRPTLYAARTLICDKALKPLRFSKLFKESPSFNNALVQNIGGGNTMVLNRAAIDLVQDTLGKADSITAHDWWIYQLVTAAGGDIYYDLTPTLLYRQHDGNLVGANDTFIASAYRILQVFQGRFREWNNANVIALEACARWTTPEAKKTLATFRVARRGGLLSRIRAMRRAKLYRQTVRGQVALWIAAITKRL